MLNPMCRKIIATASVLSLLCASGNGYAATVTTNEELESYTTTKVSPYLTRYHLTTAENIKNDYKGGEGYQCGMAFAICDANEKIMLRGDDTSGVHITNDGGKTWHMAKTKIKGVVTGLCFYPGSETVCFAHVTGMPTVAGVYKSTDGGETWKRTQQIYGPDKNMANCKITAGAYNKETGTYALYSMHNGGPSNANWKAEFAAQRGLWKSLDMGETWEQVAFAGYDIYGMYADRESDLVIVCTREFGVSVSYDGGKNWVQKNNGWNKVGARVITVDPYDKQHWLAVKTNNGTGYERYMHYDETDRKGRIMNIIYETFDGGENWSLLTTNWGSKGVSDSAGCHQLMFSYQRKNGKTVVYAQLEECIYCTRVSYDGGKTFEYPEFDLSNSLEAGSTGWYQSPMAFSPNVTQAGVYGCPAIYDEERELFVLSNSGISGGLGMTYSFDKDGKLRFIGLMDIGIMQAGEYAQYDGYDWYDGDFPLVRQAPKYAWGSGGRSTGCIAVDPKDENHCFSDAGASPYGLSSTIVETFDGYNDRDANTRVYQGIYDLFEKERADGTNSRNISFVKISPSNSNVIYSSWFVSEDNGKNWRESKYRIYDCGNQNGDICYTVVNDTLYISTDRAKNWKNTGFTFEYVRSGVWVDVSDDYVVWVPCHGGSTLWRVDLQDGSVRAFGPDNGICTPSGLNGGTDLQITNIAQDPNDSNHLIIAGTDYYDNSAGYNFETFDGGNTFDEIGVIGGRKVFHPTKPLVYMGAASGTWVYNFDVKARLDNEYFFDIANSEYKAEIKACGKADIFKYDINGNFNPKNKLTRAEAARMICIAKDDAADGGMQFTDVSGSNDNYAYIATACQKGYMSAPGGKFRPDDEVKFSELAEYIVLITENSVADAYDYCKAGGIFKNDFSKNSAATKEKAAYAMCKALALEPIEQ